MARPASTYSKFCRSFALLFACAVFGETSSAAENELTALQAPVDTWVAAFNRWEASFPANVFADDAVVIDQFPTFLWTGPQSARTWWSTMMGTTPEAHERGRALHEKLELGSPEFVQVKGDQAYFVTAATLSWLQDGAVHEMKARWVVTERRAPAGWMITSHAWAPVLEITH